MESVDPSVWNVICALSRRLELSEFWFWELVTLCEPIAIRTVRKTKM